MEMEEEEEEVDRPVSRVLFPTEQGEDHNGRGPILMGQRNRVLTCVQKVGNN